MPAMAGQLNEAADPRPHIPPAALYTASGWNQRGITNQIWRDLRQRFPDRTPPAFPGITPDSFVAYACLEANGWTSPNRISGSASTEAEPLCAQKRRTLRQRFPPASASTGRFWCI